MEAGRRVGCGLGRGRCWFSARDALMQAAIIFRSVFSCLGFADLLSCLCIIKCAAGRTWMSLPYTISNTNTHIKKRGPEPTTIK